MPKIPAISAKEMLRGLLSYGCEIVRIKGSHYRLRNRSNNRMTSLPMHNVDMKPGTFAGILRDLGIPAQDFIDYLK